MQTVDYDFPNNIKLAIKLDADVYKPAEDTFLLAGALNVANQDKILELGTGTGIIGIYCAKLGCDVTATDVSASALELAKENARLNNVRMEFVRSNLFGRVRKVKFDAIVFNPPYLPTAKEDRLHNEIERAWNGGRKGNEIIFKFLSRCADFLARDGKIFVLSSSLSATPAEIRERAPNFKVTVLGSKNLFFETIYALQLRLRNEII